MSQYTSEYGQDFINGLLAGQKMKQFQSDLKTSELQRQLLDQQFQHNAVMQPLLAAHQQAVNENDAITNQNLTLANELAKRTFESTAQRASAEASKATTEASTAQTEAKGASLKLLQELGGTLAGSHQFSDADLGTLLEQNGAVGSSAADKSMMTQVLRNSIQQGQQRLDENKARIGVYQSEIDRNTKARLSADFLSLSDLASQNPEGFSAAKDQLKTMYPPALVEAAGVLGVESARRRSAAAANTTITQSPGEIEAQKDLGKQIADLTGQLYAEKRNKTSLEQGRHIPSSEDRSTFGIGGFSRSDLIKQSQQRIDELQGQINEIRTQLAPVEKKIEKNGSSAVSPQRLQQVRSALGGVISKDADLTLIQKALKTQRGLDVTIDELKALQVSR